MKIKKYLKQIGKLDNEIWSNQVKDFIAQVIRPKNSGKVILIGNSLGSLVALTCAVSLEDQIATVIASPLPDQIQENKKFMTKKSSFKKFQDRFIRIFFLFFPLEIILFLIRTLERRNGLINRFDKDSFSFSVRDQIEGMRQFLCQHYALSSRRDTPYWKHVTEEIVYDNVTAKFEKPKHPNPLTNSFVDLAFRLNQSRNLDITMGGLPYIAAGMGYNPVNISEVYDSKLSTDENYWKETKTKYEKHRAETQLFIDKMPSHYQFLKDNLYKDTTPPPT